MNSAIAGYIGAAIGVPLIFFLLRKGFPSLSVYEPSFRSLDDLRNEFAKWEFFIGIIFIIFAGLSGYLWWLLFVKIEMLSAHRFENAIFVIASSGSIWAFPAMAAGMGSGAILADYVLKLLLKERYKDYSSYQNLKYKINTEALGKPFLSFLGIATFLIIFLLMNWYTIFMPGEVKVNRFWSLSEEKYQYKDITRIVTAPLMTAPNGSIVNRREYVIIFNNGKKWTTNLAPRDLTLEQKNEIAQFISKASQIPISEVKILEKNEVY